MRSYILFLILIFTLNNIYSQSKAQIEGIASCNGKIPDNTKVYLHTTPKKPDGIPPIIFKNGKGKFKEFFDLEENAGIYISIYVDNDLRHYSKGLIHDSKYKFGPINICEKPIEMQIDTTIHLNIKTYDSESIAIRKAPSTNSPKLRRRVFSGDSYEIIDSTNQKGKINWDKFPDTLVVANDFWYKIKIEDEIEGWIHGCYTNKSLGVEKAELKIKTRANVKLFIFASTENEVIGQLPKGVTCDVLEFKREYINPQKSYLWYKVNYENGLGLKIQGWVKFKDSSIYRLAF